MVEKIIVNPSEVRGLGDILEAKSTSDYTLYGSTLSSGTDTVYGATENVMVLGSTNTHNYSLSFGSNSYTAWAGKCTVTVTLLDGSTPVNNATISVSGGTGGTGTGTTNSSGVATINVTGVTASGTLTASFQSATATATVTYSPYIFYDDCSSSSGLSNYASSSTPLRSNGTNTLTYDSTEEAYLMQVTTQYSESMRSINALDGYTGDFKVSITSKAPDSSHPAPTGLVMYFDDNNWYAIKEGSDKVWTGQKVNGNFSETSKTAHNLQGHLLVTEISVDNTNHTMNIKTYENGSLINYTDYTINTASATSSVKYGLDNSYATTDKVNFYEIKVETL